MIDVPQFNNPFVMPQVSKPDEPKIEETPKQELSSRDKILAEMKAIEDEYGGVGNVPLNHRYYTIRNQI